MAKDNRILVDDLPYVDQEYGDPSLREAALAMVEEETRRYRPTKNYLGHLPALDLTAHETPLMKAEFERLSQKKPMDVLSMKRYELPPPSTGRLSDLQAWTECVDNSMAQLEHQATRSDSAFRSPSHNSLSDRLLCGDAESSTWSR